MTEPKRHSVVCRLLIRLLFDKKDRVEFLKFLTKYIQYPYKAIDEGIQGVVHVSFVIDKNNGRTTQVEVINDVHPSFGNAVIHTVSASPPLWTPGKNKQQKRFSVLMELKVIFVLADSIKSEVIDSIKPEIRIVGIKPEIKTVTITKNSTWDI